MAIYQITAVRKPDVLSQLEHITHVRAPAFSASPLPIETVIGMMRSGHSFYIGAGRYRTNVEVGQRDIASPPYIRTRPDDSVLDKLLSLPPC